MQHPVRIGQRNTKVRNMKNILAAILAVSLSLFLFGSAEAAPAQTLEELPGVDIFDYDTGLIEPERADRHPRVTCDLLSVSLPFGSLGHSACAAHCLALKKGYRGGRCKDGVCHCRR
ncbi:UNVERIFIED_CONTAM: hypothetical protein PYX00_001999 [Menopon gallinae]|uniref:Invertebrate defensins family profile domain-containing protein n=1 Tax=Menopon gallinae TaxID=328185 RepID=A0AAW2IFM1_9NEOP